MPATYGELWRRVRMYSPGAPAFLVQDWVFSAYRKACDERNWSFLRGENEISVGAVKTGSATATNGSAVVVSSGGASGIAFAASDVGRQIRLSTSGPPLVILSVDVTGNTSATLERAWGGTTSTGTVTVLDAYAIMPADFGHFIVVLDPQQQRRVRIFTTEAELNAADPGRLNTGTPWALVSLRESELTASVGLTMYEWYPYWTGSTPLRYPYLYYRRPQKPADDDYLRGPMRDRDDVILTGALANAARWPGTREEPNPYFNLQLAGQLDKEFMTETGKLEVKDEETYLTWWITETLGRYGMSPITPSDASYRQSHEG